MSAILSADDLNDFISPGVACIKPVETLPSDETTNPYEVTIEDKIQAQNPAPASISLTDCLACSGCVTSAEAVLVSLQSHTEVLNTLNQYSALEPYLLGHQDAVRSSNLPSDAKLFVASVSPQVRASLAATFGISQIQAGHMIEQFLSGSEGLRKGGKHMNGFTYVVDTNRMREACLILGADEVSSALADKSKSLPILTSACPGWVCYAEKTHPHVLPHLSALKSPQALTGTLLKSVLSKKFNIHPSQIWHLAIMPCFDKKLEASREELTDKWWSDQAGLSLVRDVDCVITSRELLTLAEARDIPLASLPLTEPPASQRAPFPDPRVSSFILPSTECPAQSIDYGTSGGYLAYILQAHRSLHPGSRITTLKGRNVDVVEYTLISSSNQPLLKCARFYGFRNIQNLVRKLKPARQSKLPGAARRAPTSASSTDYSYVEVMACPGGCTNGGGQIRIEDVVHIIPQTQAEAIDQSLVGTSQGQKEWLVRVDEAYFSGSSDSETEDGSDTGRKPVNSYETVDMMDIDPPVSASNGGTTSGVPVQDVRGFLNYWSELTQISLGKLAYTNFRQVESDVGKKSTTKKMGDTERIAAIAGLQGGGW